MNPYKEAVKHVGPVITDNQLKKWASDGHKARANTLANSSNIKGLFVVNDSKKLKAMYMPRVVLDEDNNPVIVGTISNHADKPVLHSIPAEALKSHYVVVEKSHTPEGTAFGDVPLDLANPLVESYFPVPESETEHPDQGKLYVAKPPIMMPVPLNTSTIVLGDIFDQGVEATPASIHDEWGQKWLYCIQKANAGLADILAKEDDLKQYLPKTQAREMEDPLCCFTAPKDDDENIEAAEKTIIAECERIVEAAKEKPLPSEVGGENDVESLGGGGDKNINSLLRLMSNGFASAKDTSEKSSQLRSTKRHFEGITKLLTSRIEIDPRSGEKVLVLGTLSQVSQLIIDSATSVRAMAQIFDQGLSQTTRKHQESENYLLRNLNLPLLEQTTKGYMGTGIYHQKPLKNLADKKLEGFVITMLIPDTKDSAQKKQSKACDTVAKEALGETAEKRSKISTEYTPVGSLNSLDDLLAMLSNDVARLATLAEFNEYAMKNKKEVPFLVYAWDKIAKLLTNRKAKTWLKEYKDTVRAPALYLFIAHRITNMVIDLGEAYTPLDQTNAACENRVEEINIEPYLEAETLLENTIDEIRRVILGTEVISSPFFENSDAKKQHDKNTALKLRSEMGGINTPTGARTNPVTPNNTNASKRKGAAAATETEDAKPAAKKGKKQPTHTDPENLGTDGRDGYLIMTNQGTGKLKLPTELDDRRPNHFSICRNFYIKGGNCRFGSSCRHSHKHPAHLPLDKAQSLWDFMASDAAKEIGVVWNTELVTAKEMTEAGVNTKE